jgi:hypothetical protein
MNEVGMEMPRYRSHKQVWALKIKNIVAITSEDLMSDEGPKLDGATIYPEDAGYGPLQVDQAYVAKHEPKVGGYYVVYRDGYKSWSPAAEFEDGYTRVSP